MAYPDHTEFNGKIAAYHDVGTGQESSMHGPAVLSLLAGNRIGTALGVKVYYVAAPHGVPGYPQRALLQPMLRHIFAPVSPRTTAEVYRKDDFGYTYFGQGGLNWAVPYAAGVLASGLAGATGFERSADDRAASEIRV